MKKTKVVSYRLPVGLPARLRQRAREEGRTITQVLTDAVELYLAVGGREGFLAEVRAAKDYARLAAALVAWSKKPKDQSIDDFLAGLFRQAFGEGLGE